MKSRAKAYTKKDIEWLCEEAMSEIDRCINSNGIVFLIALMRHAGWKKKRIEDFLLTLNSTMDEYHSYCIDGVFDYMAEKELAGIGIDMAQLLPKPLPFKQQLHKSELERKPNINISEAKKLHEEMSEFHEYFRTNEDKNASTKVCNI